MEPKKGALKVYDWRNEEYLLVDWYARLVQDGDMATTFYPDMRYLSNFLAYFRGRVTLGLACDDRGVWFACWIEPFLSGGFFGIWIRQDKRTSPSALKCTIEAYNDALKVCTVLIGICKQEHLRELHVKLGYKRAATIPGLWNGDSVDVYYITRDMWQARGHGEAKDGGR